MNKRQAKKKAKGSTSRKRRKPNQNINQHLSWDNLRRLENLAKAGNSQGSPEKITVRGKPTGMNAGEFLKAYNRQLAEENNWRLAQLRRSKMTNFAFEKAQAFIKSQYGARAANYKADLGEDYEAMRRQILSMQRFESYQTSTKQGYKEILHTRVETARKNWFSDNPKMSDAQIEEFLRFIGNKSVQDVLITYGRKGSNAQYTSEELVEDIIEEWDVSSNAILDKLKDVIDTYMSAEEMAQQGIVNEFTEEYRYDDLEKYLKVGRYSRRGKN
jgi:hypothetical protein